MKYIKGLFATLLYGTFIYFLAWVINTEPLNNAEILLSYLIGALIVDVYKE